MQKSPSLEKIIHTYCGTGSKAGRQPTKENAPQPPIQQPTKGIRRTAQRFSSMRYPSYGIKGPVAQRIADTIIKDMS